MPAPVPSTERDLRVSVPHMPPAIPPVGTCVLTEVGGLGHGAPGAGPALPRALGTPQGQVVPPWHPRGHSQCPHSPPCPCPVAPRCLFTSENWDTSHTVASGAPEPPAAGTSPRGSLRGQKRVWVPRVSLPPTGGVAVAGDMWPCYQRCHDEGQVTVGMPPWVTPRDTWPRRCHRCHRCGGTKAHMAMEVPPWVW